MLPAGAAIVALSSWLGKVWAGKLMQADKAQHDKTLQLLQAQTAKDIEQARAESEAVAGN